MNKFEQDIKNYNIKRAESQLCSMRIYAWIYVMCRIMDYFILIRILKHFFFYVINNGLEKKIDYIFENLFSLA